LMSLKFRHGGDARSIISYSRKLERAPIGSAMSRGLTFVNRSNTD
jgi:hypothetical protein